MTNPLLEKLDKDFPLVPQPAGRFGLDLDAYLRSQRSATLRRVVEQLIDIGVLSSDRQHRAAVEALTAEILEMLEAKK